jgi:ABC-2 type transport system ATP-binding protein
MTAEPVLAVQNLRFRYPGTDDYALLSISFELVAGEVLGILGANGSGKSTLLAALLDVRSGERHGAVRFYPREAGDHRGRIGYLAQQPSLYLSLTLWENLVHAARLVLPRRAVRPAVRRAVAEFRLGAVVDRPLRELSGGWRQLCHLAVSFVHDPPVRLLDEPTTALDFETRERVVQLVKGWAARGVACVVTSHYPEDLEQMCTRMVVIRQGESIRSACLADLLAQLRPTLVIELETVAGPRTMSLPLPDRFGDVSAAVEAAAERYGAAARVVAVRLSGGRLRDLLQGDPELAGVVRDE